MKAGVAWRVTAAAAIAVASTGIVSHAVPLDAGLWLGFSSLPGPTRLAVAALLGALVTLLLARQPLELTAPLVAFGLAALPLVTVIFSGGALPLLAFQGPVLVLVAGGVLAVIAARSLALAGRPRSALREPVLFVATFLAYVALGFYLPGAAGAQGDEPHYLVMAQSLWSDGDLDLSDEYGSLEHAAFYPTRLDPHVSPNSPPGRLYSLHGAGLALLVLPGYALAGYAGARVVMYAVAALVAVLCHRVVLDSFGFRAAAAAWLIVAFAPPLPLFATRLYPELPAALATAAFLLAGRAAAGRTALLGAAAAAAVLPWLHTKFLPLAAVGLLLAQIPPHGRRERAVALLLPALSLAGLLVFFQLHYGRASLSAAFGPPDLRLERAPWGLGALFLDRQFGLFAVSPVWLLALPGAVLLWRSQRSLAWRALLLAAAPLAPAIVFATWWGGACPPARYVLPALPALLLALVPAARLRRDAAAALAGMGVAVVALAAAAPRILHNRADGESRLLRFLSPLDLDATLPSFFDPGLRTALLALTALAALVVAWRYGRRGVVLGLVAYAAVASAVRETPWIDRRVATLRLLEDWQPAALRGPAGPPPLDALAVPLELPRAPWTFVRGQRRRSRRLDLPPGSYRLELAARHGPGATRLRVGAAAARVKLAASELTEQEPTAAPPLFLPVGARGFGVTATGVAGAVELVAAQLRVEDVLPADERSRFPWPRAADTDRYRVPDGDVCVTAIDVDPDGDGFRLAGEQGTLVVDGPSEAVVALEVVRPAVHHTDALEWAQRSLRLGPHASVALRLPLAEGTPLGGRRVVRLWLRAPQAWVRLRAQLADGH